MEQISHTLLDTDKDSSEIISESANNLAQLTNGKFKRVDVPLEIRLSYLDIPNIQADWLNAARIAKILDVNERWFYRVVKELGITPEIRIIDGVDLPAYPPYTVHLLEEELAWREHYDNLPKFIGIRDIAEYSGRSPGWVSQTLDDLNIKPEPLPRNSIRPIKKYKKTVLTVIRNINMAVPLADNWYSIGQLCEELPHLERSWILRRLKEADCEPQERRSSLTGKVLPHYPPEALDIIAKYQNARPKPGAEWYTTTLITDITGKSGGWVRRRLMQYESLSEIRTDDKNVPRLHYPPTILKELIKEAEAQDNIPAVGDYLSLNNIARKLGHTAFWAEERVKQLGIQPEPRKDKIGRIFNYYPPETVGILQEAFRSEGQSEAPKEQVMHALFAVGSLRSKIRANKSLTKQLFVYKEQADTQQLSQLQEEIINLYIEHDKAARTYYRLAAKYKLPFTHGLKDTNI